MAAGKTIRLSKLAREFNVGIHTIVEFLHKKGREHAHVSGEHHKIHFFAFQMRDHVPVHALFVGIILGREHHGLNAGGLGAF